MRRWEQVIGQQRKDKNSSPQQNSELQFKRYDGKGFGFIIHVRLCKKLELKDYE